MLPRQLRGASDFGDRRQDFLRPVFIIWFHRQDRESVSLGFHPDAFRIIDVQIDFKSGRKFGRKIGVVAVRKFPTMSIFVYNSINTDAVEPQPKPDMKR